MKKKITSIMAVVMAFCCFAAMSVSAARSPIGGVAVSVQNSVLPENTTLAVANIGGDQVVREKLNDAAGALAVQGALTAVYDIVLLNNDGTKAEDGAVANIRVDISGLRSYDTVEIVHLGSAGAEKIIGTSYDGYVYFQATSFSPFAFYITLGNEPAPGPGETTPESPQTGVY